LPNGTFSVDKEPYLTYITSELGHAELSQPMLRRCQTQSLLACSAAFRAGQAGDEAGEFMAAPFAAWPGIRFEGKNDDGPAA
jgi:hypothetical protein